MKISLSLLQEANTGNVIGRENAEGKGEDSLFGMVDELTRKIKTLVKLPEDKITSDLDMAIGDITTSSPEAYKFFSEGTKLYFKTEYAKAIPLLENAVALDPGLTLAYRHLAASHSNLGNYSEQKKYQQKAYESAGRASEKVRLLVLGGYYYIVQNDFEKSFETYKKLVQLYPNDTLGNRMLSIRYQAGLGDTEASVKHREIAFRNYPENAIDCTSLSYLYTLLGRINEAGDILEQYLDDYPDNPVVHKNLAENLINQKKYDEALTELERLFRLAPIRWNYALFKGDIYFLKGELSKGEHEYKTLLETEDTNDMVDGLFRISRLHLSQGKYESSKNMLTKMIEITRQHGQKDQEAYHRANLSYLHLQTGNFSEALAEREKAKKIALELDNVGMIRGFLGREAEIHISLRSMADAEKAAEELKKSLEKEINKREFKLYHWVIGKIEFEKENFEKAVNHFEQAISLSYPFMRAFSINDYIIYLEPLAKTHFRTGNLKKARVEYEKITSHPTARRDFGDIYARSFYMLGQIYEQQGKKTKAIENYEKFLDLWKTADSGIVEVEDARKRLSALKKN